MVGVYPGASSAASTITIPDRDTNSGILPSNDLVSSTYALCRTYQAPEGFVVTMHLYSSKE